MYKSIKYFLTVLLFGLFTVQTNVHATTIANGQYSFVNGSSATAYVLGGPLDYSYALQFGISGMVNVVNGVLSFTDAVLSFTHGYASYDGATWTSLAGGTGGGHTSYTVNSNGQGSGTLAMGVSGLQGTEFGSSFSILASLLNVDSFQVNPNGLGFTLTSADLQALLGGIGGSELCVYLDMNAQLAPIPEPATMGLLISGLLGGVATRRRQKKAVEA